MKTGGHHSEQCEAAHQTHHGALHHSRSDAVSYRSRFGRPGSAAEASGFGARTARTPCVRTPRAAAAERAAPRAASAINRPTADEIPSPRVPGDHREGERQQREHDSDVGGHDRRNRLAPGGAQRGTVVIIHRELLAVARDEKKRVVRAGAEDEHADDAGVELQVEPRAHHTGDLGSRAGRRTRRRRAAAARGWVIGT